MEGKGKTYCLLNFPLIQKPCLSPTLPNQQRCNAIVSHNSGSFCYCCKRSYCPVEDEEEEEEVDEDEDAAHSGSNIYNADPIPTLGFARPHAASTEQRSGGSS